MEVSVWDMGAAAVCVRLSPCFSVVTPSVGDPLLGGIFWASELFARPFVVGELGFFLCWGSGRLSTRLAPNVQARGGGTGTDGLISFSTDSSCRHSRMARRRGRGGGVRQDECCCTVPRAGAFRRPQHGPSGARELQYVSYCGRGLGAGWSGLVVLLPWVDAPLSPE